MHVSCQMNVKAMKEHATTHVYVYLGAKPAQFPYKGSAPLVVVSMAQIYTYLLVQYTVQRSSIHDMRVTTYKGTIYISMALQLHVHPPSYSYGCAPGLSYTCNCAYVRLNFQVSAGEDSKLFESLKKLVSDGEESDQLQCCLRFLFSKHTE